MEKAVRLGKNEYQALIIEFIDAGGEFPIAGTGFHRTMRMRRAAGYTKHRSEMPS